MICDTKQTNNEQLRGKTLLLTGSLLTRLFILLLVLPVLSHLRVPSCFLALWGSSCIVSLSCGLEKFPLASFFWPWSATSRSFPWDVSVGRCRGFDSWFELLGSAINLVHSPVPGDWLPAVLSVPSTVLILLSSSHQKIMGPWHLLEISHNIFSYNITLFLFFLWAVWVHLTSFEGFLMCIFSSKAEALNLDVSKNSSSFICPLEELKAQQ